MAKPTSSFNVAIAPLATIEMAATRSFSVVIDASFRDAV
jgi:hypothetical protein